MADTKKDTPKDTSEGKGLLDIKQDKSTDSKQSLPKPGEGDEPKVDTSGKNPVTTFDKNDPPRDLAIAKGGTPREFPEQPVDDLNQPAPAMVGEPIAGHPPDKDDVIVNEFNLEVPPDPPLFTDTWPKGVVPEPAEGDQKTYEGVEPRLVMINPLASIQENAAKINEKLIKQCLKDKVDYWTALNILKYCARTLGADYVRVRDGDKPLPEIKTPEPVIT